MKKKKLNNGLKIFVRLGLIMVIIFTIMPIYQIRIYNHNRQQKTIQAFEKQFEIKDNDNTNIAKNLLKVKGVLYIPKIDVKLPIYEGVSEMALINGVGSIEEYENTNNEVLTSHNGLSDSVLLMNIKDLNKKDKFYIKNTKNEIEQFSVIENKLVSPDNERNFIEKFNDNNKYVTLRTCSLDGANRIHVIGKKTKFSGSMDKFKFKISIYEIVLLSISVLALLLLILSFVGKGERHEKN